MLGSQEAVRMCILSYLYYLSGSKPRMHSFEAEWWNSCSRFKHCAMHSAIRTAKLNGHFPTQTVRRDSLLVVGITPTGNRDAGKFAPDATQLPTGCQPESLAKPARRRSHKATQPQLLTRRASSTIIRLGQKTSQACRRRLRPP